MINVTKTFFPPLEQYEKQLRRIWKNEWMTNRGELALELESKIKMDSDIENMTLMTNGTLPLQIALKVLGNQGEIITTPFSYIATTSAIVWENCTPVFVDIHADYLTIDETKIEAAITNKTTAILATHVFGNPCHVEAIDDIAKKHNLKVIYDAAHCFGVKYKGKSIFQYGDVSTCSFHATKLFHTGEGGAIFCKDNDLMHKLFYSHNFGHNGPSKFHGLGINAKISELQAAMGLAVFPYMDEIINSRKLIVENYNNYLDFNKVVPLKIREGTNWNFSYYPIIFESEKKLLKIQHLLNKNNIFPRRYFNPSLNTLRYLDDCSMPISEEISSRILCLPLYKGLELKSVNQISKLIIENV
ncbi:MULTISPECIES: DegT/DnrJ/EryC1/StrS family aminotransferase [Croceibacter]|uniref:DegT/DnrJ/EryC1/StrS family aminotransferase n=1 Tax=Croceibacter TaxID=216431 RepID=UPI000C5D26A2|nr:MULTISPECIES: DegT/DnrJ/EryC1/StrS family aminotransferase [Croceibacter]MBG24873.1 aminotransferase DegT [Croceibacter sp.]|tara:strand:+ start:441 stop:1514 length:1074 start_codon:yes stop_codon:yes gene_type:complete